MPPRSGKPVVLVVTSTFPRWAGDSEPRFVLDLCRALSPDYRMVVLAPHCRGAAQHEELEGIEVRRFRYLPDWGERLAYEGGILPKLRRRPWLWCLVPVFMAALMLAIASELRRRRIDLIHAHWLIPQGVAVLLARSLSGHKVPLVCTAHGSDVLGLSGPLSRALQRWVANGCARVGVVSPVLGDELQRRGVGAEKLRVLPMGVDLSGSPGGIAREPGLVATAGRVVEQKGIGVLLEAFRVLGAAGPRLVIAGGGPDLDRFRHQAADMGLAGCATFLGPVPHDQVLALFSRAAVVVVPSLSEGLGLTVLEAMAAGCLVVASDLPAIRGVIRHDENGVLFAAGDAGALARALERALEDRASADRLAHCGRREVEARYSWGAVAASHAAVYEEMIRE